MNARDVETRALRMFRLAPQESARLVCTFREARLTNRVCVPPVGGVCVLHVNWSCRSFRMCSNYVFDASSCIAGYRYRLGCLLADCSLVKSVVHPSQCALAPRPPVVDSARRCGTQSPPPGSLCKCQPRAGATG